MRAIVIGILLIASSPIFAQSGNGTITGSLTDKLGRTIMSARVEVRNSDSNAVYVATTNRLGEYTLSLPRGTYTLSIEIAGQKYTQETVIIIPEHPLHHDVTFPLP
jgi:hypothetical protein